MEDSLHNWSSLAIAGLLGFSLLSNSLEMFAALLIIVAVFYAKPSVPVRREYEGDFSI